MRLRRVHLKRKFLERAPLDESAFNRLAMLYDPMPVGAVGHPCELDRFTTGHGFTFTLAYADEMGPTEPNAYLMHAHRRMH